MDHRQQTFGRLVGALEELVTQEAATVATGDYVGVEDIQRRAEPLVEAIVGFRDEFADDVARARVAGLLARRQHTIDSLESQLATSRAELIAIQESTLRAARIAPVYGRPLAAARDSQFRATG